jgi:methylated-DNA-[protein]-cysteine S-methyltransferase
MRMKKEHKMNGRTQSVPVRASGVPCVPLSASSVRLETFPTALGWIALAQEGDLLQGLVMGHPSAAQAEAALRKMLRPDSVFLNPEPRTLNPLSTLADDLCRFADGEPVDFAHVAIDERHLAPFAGRVVAACRRIPWGQTRSYGQLAAECGSPAAARAVGQVMARNRYPLIVPCHRVLGSGGRLGGFSAPQGLRLKRRLLAMESAACASASRFESAIA